MGDRAPSAIRDWRTRPGLWFALAGLALVGWLVSRDAELVLDYAEVLAWPLVVLLAVVLFRVPLVELFQGLVLRAFKAGPFHAEFRPREARQDSTDFDPDELSAELSEGDDDEDPNGQLEMAVLVLGLLNQAFQNQINFLRFMRGAGDGLDRAAAERWFQEYLGSQPGGAETWDIPPLLQWLTGKNLLMVSPEGRYLITPLGVRMADAADSFWYAPKVA